MNSIAENNKRIARNTLFLYFRMILVMAVTLYTSRVILHALGIEGFGLFGVIAGIVGLFSVVSGSLSSAISRYLTFELGKNNTEKLRKVFESSFTIQLLMACVLILLFMPLGYWFIGHKMNIPTGDYTAAYWVFGFSVITFCVSLLSIPYNAAIISHENMAIFSYVSIIEASLKLGVAYLIKTLADNRLIWYTALLLGVGLIIQGIYWSYCTRHFEECHVGFNVDRTLLKEIGGFAGWNFIGAASNVLRNQGNNVLLNLFFGTVVNASYTICMQVNSAVSQFTDNFMTSVNPQLTKYYARDEREEMNLLLMRSGRLAFYLCWLLGIVIIPQSKYILSLWLGTVPENASVFVQLILIFTLSESISKPLITILLATGNIRNYQLIVGGLQLMNLPISYVTLKLDYPVYSPLVVAICISQVCFLLRLIMLRNKIGLRIRWYLKTVYCRVVSVVLFTLILPFVISIVSIPVSTLSHFLATSMLYLIWTISVIWVMGLNTQERRFVYAKINKLIHRA